jgi:hypothetical protein
VAFLFGTAFGWLILAIIWRLGEITLWIDKADDALDAMAKHIDAASAEGE